MNNEDYAEGEYGPKTGIWRILRILDEVKVKTTFLTCGGIAERYPEATQAIAQQGHEIAGHGYHHEIARDLSPTEEKDIIRRTTEMLEKVSGKIPVGWRTCTQSDQTVELLMEEGMSGTAIRSQTIFRSYGITAIQPWLNYHGNRLAMAAVRP